MLPLLLACTTRPPDPGVLTAEATACETAASCRVACDAGEALACNMLGLLSHDGRGGEPQNRVEAARRYRQACDLGAGIGCYNLSQQIRMGDGVAADAAEADRLLASTSLAYERSCAAGALTWCTNLAGLVQRGEGKVADQELARRLYADTCERGEPLACLELAAMMVDGHGGSHDPAGADALLARTCERGSGPACNNLGLRVEDAGGDGGPHFRQACAAGVPMACRNLALRLPEGPEPLALLRQACDAKRDLDPVACAIAAERLLATEPTTAGGYLSRACSAGLRDACLLTVRLASEGSFAMGSLEARELLQRGCGLGDPTACAILEAPAE